MLVHALSRRQSLPSLIRTCVTNDLSSPRPFELRTVEIDLRVPKGPELKDSHSLLQLVLPRDWRDVPHPRMNPPFWAVPWPSGTALAAHVLSQPSTVVEKRCCEIGCGVGPAGIAAIVAGASHVEFIDRDQHALDCALKGAAAAAAAAAGRGRGNRVAGDSGASEEHSVRSDGQRYFAATALDWFDVDDGGGIETYDVVLAGDVFYSMNPTDDSSILAVARLLRVLVRPEGTVFAAFPVESEHRVSATRKEADRCLDVLSAAGFSVEEVSETSGAQIPGEGPEGLAASRRVLIAKLVLAGAS